MAEKQEKPKQKNSSKKTITTILIATIIVLILIDALILTNKIQKPTCIRDACFYGQGASHPYAYMQNLKQNYDKVILINEDSLNDTQTSSYITKAMMELSSNYALQKPKIISIGLDENNQPKKCYCEDEITSGNTTKFIKCNYTLQQCLDMKPKANEFMIYLKYPDYKQDKIIFKAKNQVEVQAKTGVDLYAISLILKSMA